MGYSCTAAVDQWVGPIDAKMKFYLQKLMAKGKALGRKLYKFGQFGDSITASQAFWSAFYYDGGRIHNVTINWDGNPLAAKYNTSFKKTLDSTFFYVPAQDKGGAHCNAGNATINNGLQWVKNTITSDSTSIAILMFGTNDLNAFGTDLSNDREFARYLMNYRNFLDICVDSGVIVMVSSIPPHNKFDAARNSTVTIINDSLKAIAEEYRFPFIDFHGAILDAHPDDWIGTVMQDDKAIHPTACKQGDVNLGGGNMGEYCLSNAGYNIRTFTCLQMLDKVRHIVQWDGTPDGGDDTAIPNNPTSLTGASGAANRVVLNWKAPPQASDGETADKYLVIRDGVVLDTVKYSAYTDNLAGGGKTYQYEVYALDGVEHKSAGSASLNFTAPADNTKPQVMELVSGSPTEISIVFSELVDKASAENAGNYALSNSISILSAKLMDDLKTIVLTTQARSEKTSYDLTVKNVRDYSSSANTMDGFTTAVTISHLATLISVADDCIAAEGYNRNGYVMQVLNRKDRYPLFKFDLTGFSGNHVIESARFQVYMTRFQYGTGPTDIHFHTVTHDWVEGRVTPTTWDGASPWPGDTVNYRPMPLSSVNIDYDEDWYSADVTAQVKAWIQGTDQNYGFLVKGTDGGPVVYLASKEFYDETKRPALIINFKGAPPATVPAVMHKAGAGNSVFDLNAFPNPFNRSITISVKGQAGSGMQGPVIEIFDIRGRLVEALTAVKSPDAPPIPPSKHAASGLSRYNWDAGNMPNGIYMVKARYGNQMKVSKITLVR
jgi:lysophospholipase L1-like esterase